MEHRFDRLNQLIGKDAVCRLNDAHVAVFGLGGVGGYVCEGLVRSSVGHIMLIDKDTIAPSNLNRQIIATEDTIGRPKVEVMQERLLAINPDVKVDIVPMFYLPENADEIDLSDFDYVVDAIDTITAKLELITRCVRNEIPVISSMGTGNKLDPSQLKVVDLADTKICPLARVMRRELKKRGIEHVRVVYSEEPPFRAVSPDLPDSSHPKDTPASAVFVPATAGLMIAAEIVRSIIDPDGKKKML